MALHKGLRIAVVLGIFVAALSGIHRPAFAACTSPAGIGGTITWNGTDSVIWCDGTNWYALKNTAGSSGSTGYIQFSNGSGGFSNSGITAGQQLFWDDTNKRLGIGTAAPTYKLHIVDDAANTSGSDWRIGSYAAQNVNPLSASSSTFSGLEAIGYTNGSASITTMYGGRGAVTTSSTNAITNALGWAGVTYVPTASPITNAYGMKGEVRTNHASASVTNAYAGSFAVTNTLGTITNGIGVHIGTIQGTNKWGLYSSDSTANNHFAGNVGIGTTTPGSKLQIVSTDTATTSGGVLGSAQTQMTVTPAADSSAYYTGGYDEVTLAGTKNVTGSLRARYGVAIHSGSGTLENAYGSIGIAVNASSGTITGARGAYNYSRADNAGPIVSGIGTLSEANTYHASAAMTTGYGAYNMAQTTLGTMTTGIGSFDTVRANAPTTMTVAQATRANLTVATGATITTAYGVLSDLSNAGTVANWYGLYIPALSGTAPTTSRYPVYVADTGNNYFAGNVGIGTTAPLNPLHVVGSMRVERSGTPNQYLEVSLGGASSNQLNFNSIEASKKNFVLSSLHGGTGSAAGALDFVFMTGLNSAPTEVMRIKENGNVGIGTTTPSEKFQVVGTGARYFSINSNGRTTIVANDNNATVPALTLSNTFDGGYGLGLVFALGYGGSASSEGTASTGAHIGAIQEQVWTATNATRDSAMTFSTSLDGSAAEKMRIASSGILMGRTTASSASTPAGLTIQHTYGVNYGLVLVSDNVGSSSVVRFDNPNGNVGSIVISGTTTTYTTSSDRRLKENITDTQGALDRVMQIPVRDFSFKTDATHAKQTGFIAQELAKVMPEAVATNGDDGQTTLGEGKQGWSVDYGRVTPLLLKAIQELKAANDNLRSTIEAQGREIEALKAARP